MTPDERLIEAARSGDRKAFASLVERHRGRVYGTAYALLRHEEDARDVTQETFLRAYRGLSVLEDPRRFGSWLVGIAAHSARDVRRRRGIEKGAIEVVVRRRLEARSAVLNAARRHAAWAADSIEQGGLEAETEQRLKVYVEALPEQAREALQLRFEKGLAYKEIAEEMGVPPSTVRGILHRATSTLRDRLRPHVRDATDGSRPPGKRPVKRPVSGRRRAAQAAAKKRRTSGRSQRR